MGNQTGSVSIHEVLSRLQEVRQRGDQWAALCPVHEDEEASLSISEGDEGIVLKCFAGCATEDVVARIGLTMAELFYDRKASEVSLNGHRKKSKGPRRIACTYPYYDAEGVLLFEVIRYEPKSDFPQRRPSPDGNGWIWNMNGVQRVLYRLPQVIKNVAQGRSVFLVEGEKDVATLEKWNLCATTAPGGAKKWESSYERSLVGARLILLADNDPPGRQHVIKIAEAMYSKAAEIRILDLPGLPPKGDVSDWVAAGGTYDEFTRLLRDTPVWKPEERCGLPWVETFNRPLRDVGPEAIRALVQFNSPPTIFARGGSLTRVRVVEDGHSIFQAMDKDTLIGYLSQSADYMRSTEKTTRHVTPPGEVLSFVLSMALEHFPPVDMIVETPIVRPDGVIQAVPGYDTVTRRIYAPPGGWQAPPVPERPTWEDVQAARELLAKPFQDFPFVDEASRTNLFGEVLTPHLRTVYQGSTPMLLVDSPQRGTGKGLLGDLVAIIATGRVLPQNSPPKDVDEWRKLLTSNLREGAPGICFDNIEGRFDAPALATALTAQIWKDRVLGSSETVELPIRCFWIASGNNIVPGGDIPRRCFWVRLDARQAQPWKRSGWRIPEPREWVTQQRGALVVACLTIIRYWFVKGCPIAETPVMGSFESWSRVIGSVLACAGYTDFLANLDLMYETMDTGDAQWERFLTAWYSRYQDKPKRIVEVVADIKSAAKRGGAEEMFDAEETAVALLEALPDDLAIDPGASDTSIKLKLAKALGKKLYVRYGEQNLRVEKAAADTHTKSERWAVRCGNDDK